METWAVGQWKEFQDTTEAGDAIKTVDVNDFHVNWPDIAQE